MFSLYPYSQRSVYIFSRRTSDAYNRYTIRLIAALFDTMTSRLPAPRTRTVPEEFYHFSFLFSNVVGVPVEIYMFIYPVYNGTLLKSESQFSNNKEVI